MHTNKTMRRLAKLGLHEIHNGTLKILNGKALEKLASAFEELVAPRPLL